MFKEIVQKMRPNPFFNNSNYVSRATSLKATSGFDLSCL